MSKISPLARAREWLLLGGLEARARAVPDELRAKTSRALRLSLQRRSAADALWIAGHPAEALRLAQEALDLAREAVREGAGHDEPTAIDAGPGRGPVDRLHERIEERFDQDVGAVDAERFRGCAEEQARLLAEHGELLHGPAAVRR